MDWSVNEMLEDLKRQVVKYALQADRSGLCRHKSGNFSIRDMQTGYVCITPTGMDREEMVFRDVVVIDMDARVVESENGRRPTSESLMHLAVYKSRPEVNAIVHTHSKTATAFAVMAKPIPAIVYEIFVLGCKKGYIPVAPYGRPGTDELAQSVIEPLKISDVALMQSHGVIAVAENIKDALLKASYAEELAQVYYMSLTVLGKEPQSVPIEEISKWEYPKSIK
jgi:L-ribulose-5-phosphate 4-epimerase